MEQTLDKQMMESLRELANINGEISSGKAEIIQLKKGLEEFLENRKQLEQNTISAILEESKKTIQEINENKVFVQSYYNEVSSFSKFLKEIYSSFNEMKDNFEKEQELWKLTVSKDSKTLSEIKKEIDNNIRLLDIDKKYIADAKKQIAKDKEYITNQQNTIKATINHLKKTK
jgi:hypothetical protein